MPLVYTPIYAAVLAVMFVVLSLNVIRCRLKGYWRDDHPKGQILHRAVRGHGNFAEYTPLALILIAMLELNGANAWAVNGIAGAFVLGRILHAIAFSTAQGMLKFRQAGTLLTLSSLLVGAGWNVWLVLA